MLYKIPYVYKDMLENALEKKKFLELYVDKLSKIIFSKKTFKNNVEIFCKSQDSSNRLTRFDWLLFTNIMKLEHHFLCTG